MALGELARQLETRLVLELRQVLAAQQILEVILQVQVPAAVAVDALAVAVAWELRLAEMAQLGQTGRMALLEVRLLSPIALVVGQAVADYPLQIPIERGVSVVEIHPEAHLVAQRELLLVVLVVLVVHMLAEVVVGQTKVVLAVLGALVVFHRAVAVVLAHHALELYAALAVMAERDIVRFTHGKDIRSY